MSTTNPYNQPRYEAAKQVKHTVLAASTKIPMGTFAMNDGGQVKPFTSAGYIAGAKFLGWANLTYQNTAGSPLTRDPMMFLTDTPAVASGKSGDMPVLADVGGYIALDDNNTVKKTIITGDKQVLLLELLPNNKFLVQL